MIDLNNMSAKQVTDFHRDLSARFGVKFVDPASWVYRLFSLLLHRIFKKHASEIVASVRPCCFGKYVLLPWRVGDKEVIYRRQILTAIHECEHAIRIQKYPGSTANWYKEYFIRDGFRALEEGAAHATVAEVWYWASGDYLDLTLDGYFCLPNAQKSARVAYDNRRRQCLRKGRGSATSTVSAFAIKWLKGDKS